MEDTKSALDGARYILMERFAEDAELLGSLRDFIWQDGQIKVTVVEGKENEGAKFRDYFDHVEPLKKVPSHRALAILRGRNEGILGYTIVVGDAEDDRRAPHPAEQRIAARWNIRDAGRAADKWLSDVVRWTWRVKLSTQIETDLMAQVREAAETEAINVFAANLKDLLLLAPAGPRPTLGLDPGLRTGVKVAIIDGTGQVVGHGGIFPHAPRNQWDQSIEQLATWCRQYGIELIAIGNGTASRETDALVGELLAERPALGLHKVVVSEAGASVYSASEQAAYELPELDVSLRGAVSIARRLQDPLAELVKIEPKSIGVGQYQHDVNQSRLGHKLDAVVEDGVNAVGVDANTASAPLLARVSGLGPGLAERLVAHRHEHGNFKSRSELQHVPRLGPKAFEQAAGFLRIPRGDNPLDASAVHPEAYPVVERICADTGREVAALIGDEAFLDALDPQAYTDERFGEPTVRDILRELAKPGRDPRPAFRTASFREDVERVADLEVGMVLEGTVTNVANFGAFVDIGVHQDGLVHISALAHAFVRDPRAVVRTGDVVQVKVMAVDLERKRIGLSMRLDDDPQAQPGERKPDGQAGQQGRRDGEGGAGKGRGRKQGQGRKRQEEASQSSDTALAEAFRKARS